MLFHWLVVITSLAAHISLVNSLNIRNGNTNKEYGSYVNPNPRPFERCPTDDLIKLSTCCNDVLTKLDDCKADDLACECCALQSIKQECYHLCPGNPSANFLSVLLEDCSSLNDINACSIPFKKDDEIGSQKDGAKSIIKSKVHKLNTDNSKNNNNNNNNNNRNNLGNYQTSVVIKSKVIDKLNDPNYINGNEESLSAKSKIKLILEHHENDHDDHDDNDNDLVQLNHHEDEDDLISINASNLNSTLGQFPASNSTSLNESTYVNASGSSNSNNFNSDNDENTSGSDRYFTNSIIYPVFITILLSTVAAIS